MSISELIVVIIVALIIIKPEDIPTIIKQIKKIRKFFHHIKQEFISIIDNENDDSNVEEINKYIAKILSLGKKYEGDYNLHDVKTFYHKSLKETAKSDN